MTLLNNLEGPTEDKLETRSEARMFSLASLKKKKKKRHERTV